MLYDLKSNNGLLFQSLIGHQSETYTCISTLRRRRLECLLLIARISVRPQHAGNARHIWTVSEIIANYSTSVFDVWGVGVGGEREMTSVISLTVLFLMAH